MLQILSLLLLLPVLAVLAYPFMFRSEANPQQPKRWPALGAGMLTTVLGSPLLAFLFVIVPSMVLDKNATTADQKEQIAYTTLASAPLGLLAALWLASFAALWLERRILRGQL